MDDDHTGDNYLNYRASIFVTFNQLHEINTRNVMDHAALSLPETKKDLLIQCAVLYAMEVDGEVLQLPGNPGIFIKDVGSQMMN